MRISFETDHNISSNSVHNNSQAHPAKAQSAETYASSFVISIGQNTNEIGSYSDKKGASWAEGLEIKDVELNRDYMSVMSLSMSDKDMAKLAADGELPEELDAKDAVTIIDDIKAALLRGGAHIAGYTDDIDKEVLAEITGSSTMADELIKSMNIQDVPVNNANLESAAEAVAMAASALPLSDSATQYLIENDKAPTVQNVYQAAHSGSQKQNAGANYYAQNGYLTQNAGSGDLEAIRPQIEEVISRSGLDNNETTLREAQWLINRGIGLTPENLLKLESLADLRNNMPKDNIVDNAITSVSIAMSAGIDPAHANLTYSESIYLKAEEYVDKIMNIPDEAVDSAVAEGKIVNLNNLFEADSLTDSPKAIHDRRLLEEARLLMSAETNRLLLRSNFSIDLAPMEELVDALKKAEEHINKLRFPGEDAEAVEAKANMLKQVKTELPLIRTAPAAIVAQTQADGTFTFGQNKSFTLQDVYESGEARRELYEKAGEKYEALMTAPRADLGDSIKKAFRNTDAILSDLNMDLNEANKRAVRILGYNSMEITPEKIEQVREADANLRNTIARLTPGRVINMIRDNINPLELKLSELNDYLNSQDEDPERQAANYAKFLMQLERQDEISELERESYIGIYRLLNSIDKSDDAAVGSLLQMGSEITFSNLLSAMRSTARTAMDYKVGDDFGGLDSTKRTPAIDEQIKAAFRNAINEASLNEYSEEQPDFENNMANMTAEISDSVIENLLGLGEKVSIRNLDAMELLRHKRGDWFRTAGKIMNESDLDSLTEDAVSTLTDKDSAIDGYKTLLDGLKAQMADAVYASDSALDVRMLQAGMRQLSILSARSESEEYDIPVSIDGELTAIRLQIKHETGAGELMVSMETEELGKVAAQFSLSNSQAGYIAYEKESAAEKIRALSEGMGAILPFIPDAVFAPKLEFEKFTNNISEKQKMADEAKDDTKSADINNTELYRIARQFISAVTKLSK